MRMQLAAVLVALSLGACGAGGDSGGGSSGGLAASSAAQAAASLAWLSADVGNVGQPGSDSRSGGSVSIHASGGDIWGNADAFRFVSMRLSGDGELAARVVGLENTDAWAKAGVMIRETLTAGSPFAMSVVTPSNGAGFQFRTTPSPE